MEKGYGLNNGRVNFAENQINQACIEMALRGLHASTIGRATGLSVSQVYYRVKMHGFKMRDYRDGKGLLGQSLFTKYKISEGRLENMGLKEKRALKKKYAKFSL